MSNNLISVDSLDFDGIKANIKAFLQGQSIFSDYNFEGSALSTLIDVLAYNTHYNALYTNLMLNESFIDSASKYSSVVSLAKQIGYTAKSFRSARANVQLEISDVNSPTDVMTLPKGTYFKGTVGNRDYSFYSRDTVTASNTNTSGNGRYVYNIELVEGTPITNLYTVSIGSNFVLNNKNADLSTLVVTVQANSASTTFDTFYRVDDLLNVRGVDNVYFVKQREDGFYEIYFGDGIIGKAISPGNIVYLDYMASSGTVANGCGQFYYSGGFRGDVLYQTTTIEGAIGGANKEQIEQIKFNAPRAYISQNRAVTAGDYKNQILSNFPQVETITVWGGQDNVPRKYGVVFISAKPYDRAKLNDQEKKEISDYLDRNRSVMTVQQEFVDPEILEISTEIGVYYNPQMTSRSTGELESLIMGSVQSYSNTLNTFDSSFRFSKFQNLIDGSERSIVSNITRIFLSKTVEVYYGSRYQYILNFGNPIFKNENSVISTKFYTPDYATPCMLMCNQSGGMDLYAVNSDNTSSFIKTIGTVDYTRGIVTINALLISAMYDTEFKFTVIPSSNDVIPVRNHIITMPLSKTKINIIADSISSGTSNAGTTHIFSNSR